MVASAKPGWLQTAFDTLAGFLSGGVEDKCKKNSGDSMLYMTGAQGTGIQSLYPSDVGGEAGQQGEIEGESKLPRVHKRPYKGVTGYPLPNLARHEDRIYNIREIRVIRGRRY